MKNENSEIIHVPAIKGNEVNISPSSSQDESQVNPQTLLEQNYKFFLEFSKLHEANIILKNELQNLIREKTQLKQQISKIERKDKTINELKNEVDDIYTNRKRHRRNKDEITRKYICKYPNCGKTYGSEGSLNQHRKLKHNNIKYEGKNIKDENKKN